MVVSASDVPVNLYPLAITVLLALSSALAGAVIWLLSDLRRSIRDQFANQSERIQRVENDLQRFKDAVPQQYTLREDFIRAVASLDKKIDRVISHLARLGGGKTDGP